MEAHLISPISWEYGMLEGETLGLKSFQIVLNVCKTQYNFFLFRACAVQVPAVETVSSPNKCMNINVWLV